MKLERLLLVGDFEVDEHYFSVTCQKIFSSIPVFIKNANCEPDAFLIAQHSDVVFIRIDQNFVYHFALSSKLKRAHPNVRIVWVAANSQYALPAFENSMDGYFELPLTEAKLGAMQKRLKKEDSV